MASKSFTLADPQESSGGKGPCAKFCICACVLAFVGMLGTVGVYVYQTYGGSCSAPELDENGLSNWTSRGADHIAYACFPGYFLEGESNLVVAKCQDGLWNPPTPACNSLPIRIDCKVNNQSITGNITMWQHSVEAPTHIYGRINYTLAMKPQGHLMEYVVISKRTCNVSHVTPQDHDELDIHPEPRKGKGTTLQVSPVKDEDADLDEEEESDEEEEDDKQGEIIGKILKIKFTSSQLKAYKKTELFMNLIFVDEKTTATLVSVHQANLTLTMTTSDPIHSLNSSSWNWDKEKKSLIYKMNGSPNFKSNL